MRAKRKARAGTCETFPLTRLMAVVACKVSSHPVPLIFLIVVASDTTTLARSDDLRASFLGVALDRRERELIIHRAAKAGVPSEMPFPFNLYARVVDPTQGR